MFHIFRWRREHRNESITPLDFSIDEEHKRSHSRRRRLPIYHGRQSFERLFRIRRHRSPATQDTQQVNILMLFDTRIETIWHQSSLVWYSLRSTERWSLRSRAGIRDIHGYPSSFVRYGAIIDRPNCSRMDTGESEKIVCRGKPRKYNRRLRMFMYLLLLSEWCHNWVSESLEESKRFSSSFPLFYSSPPIELIRSVIIHLLLSID